jgi:hypothetical protein
VRDWTEDLHGDGIPYIEDYDMTPDSLVPISARPVKLPVYQNVHIRSFTDWYRANEPALTEYYNAVRDCAPEGTEPLVDFFEFAATAHEREQNKLTSRRLPHGNSL